MYFVLHCTAKGVDTGIPPPVTNRDHDQSVTGRQPNNGRGTAVEVVAGARQAIEPQSSGRDPGPRARSLDRARPATTATPLPPHHCGVGMPLPTPTARASLTDVERVWPKWECVLGI